MRDGIYKNLPLSRGWQAAFKSFTLDAERDTIAREKVERAVGQDLQREIQPRFIIALREKAELSESLLPGLRVFGEVTSRDLGGQNSPLENEVLVQARILECAGGKGDELVRRALLGAVREHMERRERQIEQTILTSEMDPDAKATMSAARDAFKTAMIVPIVDALLMGNPLHLPPARRPIDLNEDLSRIIP